MSGGAAYKLDKGPAVKEQVNLAFRYVVFEEARSVLILNIKLIAGFDGGADSAGP
jgi:hypothetical protein